MAWRDGPLAAFVELRFRLGVRRLRGRGGVPELVARALSYVVLVPAAILFAGLVAAGTFQAARAGRGLRVEVPLGALLFGLWQAWTATALSLQEREGVDLGRFLLYPVRSSRIYAYGLAASVVGDPFALFWCTILAGALAGAAAGRPGAWLLPLAAVLALFAVATAAYLSVLQELAGRLLRGKRTRQVVIAGLYVGLAFGGAALAASQRRVALSELKAIGAWLQWAAWPAALAREAALPLFGGRVAAALPWILALAAATLAAGWLGHRLTLAEARAGGAAAPVRGAGAGAGWPTGALPGRLGPLLELEVKQLWRHPLPGVLLLVIPGLAAFASWKALPLLPAEAGEVVRALPLLAFALYTHLATQVFWLNAFGWDRGGARLHHLAPLPLDEVLAAKNGATYLLAAALYGLSAAAALALGGAPPAWALLAAAALHAGVAPWLYGLGNLVSVLNPRPAARTLQRAGNLPALSGLAGMAIVSAVAGVFALPVLLALRLDEGWVLPGAWAILGAGGWLAWRAALPRTGRLLARQREPLLAAVTGDDV